MAPEATSARVMAAELWAVVVVGPLEAVLEVGAAREAAVREALATAAVLRVVGKVSEGKAEGAMARVMEAAATVLVTKAVLVEAVVVSKEVATKAVPVVVSKEVATKAVPMVVSKEVATKVVPVEAVVVSQVVAAEALEMEAKVAGARVPRKRACHGQRLLAPLFYRG